MSKTTTKTPPEQTTTASIAAQTGAPEALIGSVVANLTTLHQEPATNPASTETKPAPPALRWVVYPGPHPQALIAGILFDRDKPLQVDAEIAADLIKRKKVNAAKAPKVEQQQ